jgi:hypothetical protein
MWLLWQNSLNSEQDPTGGDQSLNRLTARFAFTVCPTVLDSFSVSVEVSWYAASLFIYFTVIKHTFNIHYSYMCIIR